MKLYDVCKRIKRFNFLILIFLYWVSNKIVGNYVVEIIILVLVNNWKKLKLIEFYLVNVCLKFWFGFF